MRARTLVLALAVTTAACGDGGGSARDVPLDGTTVVVGSKDFPEQELLSEMFLQAFRSEGADVVDATGTGGTDATRAALLDGAIDAYVEYNTTGWVEFLGRTDPPPAEPEEVTAAVAALDRANGVVWLGHAPFSDTYGFALSPELAAERRADRYRVEAFDLQALAEYLDEESGARVCVAPEFRDRPDGLGRFEELTGFTVPADQLVLFERPTDIVRGLVAGECDVGEVFTTSGLIAEYDLTLVADPGVFFTYNASLTMREEVYERAPEVFARLADEVLSPLTQARMIELNRRVAGGEPVEDVALDHLRRFDVVS